ncbi:hypothetical protein UlMin_011598 [Ulmus minor]
MAKKGSIAFFATYRPSVPLDIFSCPRQQTSEKHEVPMTDRDSYNYNGQAIPKAALKTILKNPKLASVGREADVDSGRLTGMIFVSERSSLETLHIALRLDNNPPKVFSFSDVFGTFSGVRMEDSGCFAGDYLVYVSTKERAQKRRQPWTAVYKTNLNTGNTERLTPAGEADLSPSVSPSGKKIAVASFQEKGGWEGEIEDLKTDIYVIDVDNPSKRDLVIRDGGWPTWGSDNVIFFHRKYPKVPEKPEDGIWGVFRADISRGKTSDTPRVTPVDFHAMTPAAINATTVAVATIRKKSKLNDKEREKEQYRHIEIFDSTTGQSTRITQNIKPMADHFNPFVIDGGKYIGYHRANSNFREIVENIKNIPDIPTQVLEKIKCPLPEVGLFRVPGVFPTISRDGSKLAFVDNEFKNVWLVEGNKRPRIVFTTPGRDSVFSPVWDSKKDTLYVCMGPSFNAAKPLEICAIPNVCKEARQQREKLTKGGYNNAFPSPNPDGTKLVFRSTRGGEGSKNLYIMEDAKNGEFSGGKVTRLTNKKCTDTHCQWSPTGDWVVFASNRDKPDGTPEKDNGLDSGYFAVFLVNVKKPDVVIRVMASGSDIAGHVNHPFFSPDGKTIVVTADLAAVCCEPISLPLFEHSVRPYGDIFTFDIDTKNIENNKDVEDFTRITHSKYENSTAVWTIHDNRDAWNQLLKKFYFPEPASCPYDPNTGGERYNMMGHLCLGRRCC